MNNVNNALVGQSGGPTSAINSTLAGVIAKCIKSDKIDTLYGAVNGIKGLLREKLVNLTETFKNNTYEKLDLLKQTPSAYLGSCRFRLKDECEDTETVFKIMQKNNIKFFFYIGGNDSMDTVMKLAEKAKKYDIKIIGIPKTIDNDLSHTDFCPGYGSSAKYIATVISEVTRDTCCYDIESVTIAEIMGRNAGWLTAASALARVNGERCPDLIYLPEKPFDTNKFLSDVKEKVKQHKNIVIAVSEGIKDKDGNYISASNIILKEDMFGHSQLGGAGKALETLIKENLKIKVRSIELNTPQRCASHISSLTDITLSFDIGQYAVQCALDGQTGIMAVFERYKIADGTYKFGFNSVDVSYVANAEKTVPDNYISPDANNVTQEFIDYALPLIQGETSIKFANGIPMVIKL